jgi:iron complex outermembrane receptor protein
MVKIYLLLSSLLWAVFPVCAQQTSQSQVLDAQTKEPLAGVSVLISGTGVVATTQSDGVFRLPNVQPSDTLFFSYVGYQTRSFPVASLPSFILLPPSATQLNGVVVSASREAQAQQEAPMAISSLSSQVLRETKAVSLEQVLNKVSGVYMVNLGNEQHTMAIRQPIGYNSVFLYLEDGIPIRASGDFNHNALIEINLAALKTIVVIRGPSSSLYGSEAVGGAVNFLTQAPSAVPTARIQAEAGSRGYRRTDVQASGTFGKVGVFLGGYLAGQRRGYYSHSDFDKLALTLRTDYRISQSTKLTTTGTLIRYQTDQTGGLDSAFFYGRRTSSQQTFTYRRVHALRIRSTLEHQWNATNRTQATLFFRDNLVGQNPFYAIRSVAGNPLKARGEINEDAFRSFGLLTQHRKSFSWLGSSLITGLSLEYSPARYTARFICIDRSQEGIYMGYTPTDSLLTHYAVGLVNLAGYTQLELAPVERLRVVAALRYDRMNYAFDNHLAPGAFTGAPDEKNAFYQWTPKLGATYRLAEEAGSYANYSTGFAPPQIAELYRGVQVPTLRPASYANYEVGGWWSFAHNRGYLDLSVYRMEGVHEIVSVRLPDGSYQNQNAGKTTHQGVEATFKFLPTPSLTLRISGTYAVHRFVAFTAGGKDLGGNEMATAPRTIVNSELTYRPTWVKGLRLSGEWQALGKYWMDPSNATSYPGYHLFNVRAAYEFKAFEIWLHALNAGDALYATTADAYAYGKSYRPGNPRTFQLGIAYSIRGKITP